MDMDIVGIFQVATNRFLFSRYMIFSYDAEGGGRTVGVVVPLVHRK